MPNFHQIQISLKATDLAKRSFAKCNPFAVVYKINLSGEDEIIGVTEIMENTLNPNWVNKGFSLEYEFEKNLSIKISVFEAMLFSTRNLVLEDVDPLTLINESKKVRLIGSQDFDIHEIVGGIENFLTKPLTQEHNNNGFITILFEKVISSENNRSLALHLRAMALANMRHQYIFTSNFINPFFELSKRIDTPKGSKWVLIHRSEVVKKHLNPLWNKVELSILTLCNGDYGKALRIKVFDYLSPGKCIFVGEFDTDLNGLFACKSKRGNACMDQALCLKNQEGLHVGSIVVVDVFLLETLNSNVIETSYYEEDKPSFIDYLYGGCEIKLSVAIDFSSNNEPASLHYLENYENFDISNSNDYVRAIFKVGSLLAKYDSDQHFPVWGFGAQIDDTKTEYFQCGTKSEVEGVNGMINAYMEVLKNGYEASPTASFDDIVDATAFAAETALNDSRTNKEGRLSYSILLILTAGKLSNLEKAKNALIKASSSPLSVVIVGIGDSNFDDMRTLDNGIKEGRDITKFIEFNAHADNEDSLVENILEEIPDQLVDYFWDREIVPCNL